MVMGTFIPAVKRHKTTDLKAHLDCMDLALKNWTHMCMTQYVHMYNSSLKYGK